MDSVQFSDSYILETHVLDPRFGDQEFYLVLCWWALVHNCRAGNATIGREIQK